MDKVAALTDQQRSELFEDTAREMGGINPAIVEKIFGSAMMRPVASYTLKRVEPDWQKNDVDYWHASRIGLLSDRPKYEPMEYGIAEEGDFKVAAKLVEMLKQKRGQKISPRNQSRRICRNSELCNADTLTHFSRFFGNGAAFNYVLRVVLT